MHCPIAGALSSFAIGIDRSTSLLVVSPKNHTSPISARQQSLRNCSKHWLEALAELCVVNVLSVEGTGPRGNRVGTAAA